MKFGVNYKNRFLGSNPLGGYPKDKDLDLDKPYLATLQDQKLDL